MSIIKRKPLTEPVAADVPMLTAEEVLEHVRMLRARTPEIVQLPKTRATEQIRRAARINIDFAREAFGSVGASSLVQEAIGNTPEELREADADMVRWMAVETELDALLRGVVAANVMRRQRIARVALHAYNVTRVLAKEENHADLLPFVERMRRMPKFARRRKESEPQPPVVTPEPQPKPV